MRSQSVVRVFAKPPPHDERSQLMMRILYPSLRVDFKIKVMRDLPPRNLSPASMKPLNLEEHGNIGSGRTAKGDCLTKFASQFSIGPFEQGSGAYPFTYNVV